MSYDVMVFDTAGVPTDRAGFLAWYSGVARLGDGRPVADPAIASPVLRAWYADMRKGFPAISGPDAGDIAVMENDNRAEYRFAPNAVFASFTWEASRLAQRQAQKLARAHGIGLFDVSSNDAAVWSPNDKGMFQVIHRI